MSTTATFTLRDLNRQPAKILAAVRKWGSAEVKTREGEVFTIKPKSQSRGRKNGENSPTTFRAASEARLRRMQALGYVPPKPGEWDEERFNRIIAGEE